MAKVSVIIPVYKVEEYLERCVQSVLNQTLKDIEIVLVDDGSPDNCPKMCDEFAKKDSRIKVVHKNNEGLGKARNSGLEVATGEYVAFVDSDDYVHPEMYEILLNKITAYKVDAVVCGFSRDTEGKISTGRIDGMPNEETVIDCKTDYLPKVIGSLPNENNNQSYGYSVWNIFFKKDIIDKHGLRFESERIFLSEDILFQLDYAARSEKFLLLPINLYYYYKNKRSITQKYDNTRFNRSIELYKEICRRVKSFGLPVPQMDLRLKRVMLYESLFAVSEAIRSLSFNESVSRLKIIANNEVLQGVLDAYPINEMKIQNRIVYTLLKNKSAYLVWFLYKIKKVFC